MTHKTKPLKADTTILGNKTLLRYFRKFNDTSNNENKDILEYQTPDIKVSCLPLSMMLTAFHTSHCLHTKGHSGAEKTYSNFTQNFYFPNAPIWIKVLCNDCITCHLNKPYPNQKQIAEKQDFKAQSLYFKKRISFDAKEPISPSSEVNSYIMVILDAFTHYDSTYSRIYNTLWKLDSKIRLTRNPRYRQLHRIYKQRNHYTMPLK